MSYLVSKYQDLFTLTNTDEVALTFTLEKSDGCGNFSEVISDTVLNADESYDFENLVDGEYNILISQDGEDTNVPFKNYNTLLVAIIEDIKYVLCGCDCGCGCDDCEGEDMCNILLVTKTKMDVFKRLMNPQYVSFFDAVYSVVDCYIQTELYCSLDKEMYYGELSYNQKLFKIILALDYLAIYFYELNTASDEEEEDYVKTKFKSSDILCCISKLGIDIDEIETLIENNMGTLTINSASYVNQPPSQVGDYTLGVDNRAVTVLTLDMFSTLTTPVYTDPEGDPIDAVRIDTLPADGVLYLDGVAVTAGQVIDVADINSNLLTYESPDQDAFDSDSIDFSLRDTGSGTFSS